MKRDELTAAECRALLGSVPFGRVVYTDRALPAIEPARYSLEGEDVVVSTGLPVQGTVVAFQIDDFDRLGERGWSVVVVGRARREGDRLRIVPEIVNGHRLV